MHLVCVKCHGITNSVTNLVTYALHEQSETWCLRLFVGIFLACVKCHSFHECTKLVTYSSHEQSETWCFRLFVGIVWRVPFAFDTWLIYIVTCFIHMCDLSHAYMGHMTHSHVWYWLIHVCAMTFTYVPWLTHMCHDLYICPHVWRDSFILICDVMHSYVWYDLFACACVRDVSNARLCGSRTQSRMSHASCHTPDTNARREHRWNVQRRRRIPS